MNAQDLKNSILQLAIQGKLVEQRKDEGTAKKLIEEIKAEKERLIKEKKIKQEKPLAEITEDEVPFEIPESWEWIKFRDICAVLTCGYASTPKYVSEDEGMPFISAKNVKPYKFMPEDHNFISKELYEKLTKTCNPQKGDILLTRVGAGIGEAAIIDCDFSFAIYVSLTLIKLVNYNLLNNRYILYWLNSPLGVMSSLKNIFGKNASQGNLNVENVRNFLLPVPPLEEQKRIVAKIEELMPYIEKYGEAHSKLEVFNKKFPEDMQKSILQYAIQGKLVVQREEEGTAEELYKQIQEEKEKLIKEKKIKKEKPLAEITEYEVPFEIPESWKWVRLGELCSYGKCNSISSNNISDDAWVLDLEDIEKDSGRVIQKKRMIDVKSASSKHVFKIGNVLYSKLRPYLNKVVIADENGYCTSEILPLDFGKYVYNRYAQVVLMNPYFIAYTIKCSYGVKMPRLGTSDGQMATFPLPPLAEQKRIVAKIEEMLPYCQQLVK